jgi:hypothetical protein
VPVRARRKPARSQGSARPGRRWPLAPATWPTGAEIARSRDTDRTVDEPDYALTGRVLACGRCAVRFAAADRCPRCGSGVVADLREPEARARPAVVGGAALAVGVAAVIAPQLAAGMAGVLVFVVALHRFLAFRPARPRRELAPLPAARHLAGAGPRVAGHVHVVRAVTSPLGGRACAAFRLTGIGPGGLIDDAEVGVFDVMRVGRAVARVDGAHALVDLGAMPAVTPRAVDGRLVDFLRARGDLPDGAGCALAEAVLLEGDPVEVAGAATVEIVASGPRETHEQLVFREWAAIRRGGPGNRP